GSQEDYFELYRQSAIALKQVDRRLTVGGPSTAQLGWIPDMIRFCSQKGVPIDFVSSHVYPEDPQKQIFGKEHAYPYDKVIPAGVKLAKHQIESSSLHAFNFLHRLGDLQLQTSEGPVLATRRSDGSVAILVWNLIPHENALAM